MPKPATTAAGVRAEEDCAAFLRKRGLQLLSRNWRCRLGEIDLIAEDRGVLVFVEVRMRRTRSFGGAAESVTLVKRRRIVAAARAFLASRGRERECRFDVMLVEPGDPQVIDWIRDAFAEC